jgi:hypothetical protein
VGEEGLVLGLVETDRFSLAEKSAPGIGTDTYY